MLVLFRLPELSEYLFLLDVVNKRCTIVIKEISLKIFEMISKFPFFFSFRREKWILSYISSRIPGRQLASASSRVLNPPEIPPMCTDGGQNAKALNIARMKVRGVHKHAVQRGKKKKDRVAGERKKKRDQSVSSRVTHSVAVVVPLCRNDTSPLFPANSPPNVPPPPVSTSWHTVPLTRTQTRRAAPSGNTSVATFHCGPTTRQRKREREKRGRWREEEEEAHDRGTREMFSRFSSILDRAIPRAKLKDNASPLRRTAETVYGDRGRAEAESLVERP